MLSRRRDTTSMATAFLKRTAVYRGIVDTSEVFMRWLCYGRVWAQVMLYSVFLVITGGSCSDMPAMEDLDSE